MTMNHLEFLTAFEDHSLPPEQFDHIGHLRIAWLYLINNKLDEAIYKVTTGISSYATSLGATDKFQHTLTEAIVRIMAIRANNKCEVTFPDFLTNNPDLVENLPKVLNTYYSHDRLNSDLAKRTYLEPDRQPF